MKINCIYYEFKIMYLKIINKYFSLYYDDVEISYFTSIIVIHF